VVFGVSAVNALVNVADVPLLVHGVVGFALVP
jgi:hypothetical protein